MLSNIHARDREKVAIDQRPQKRKTLLSGLAPLVLAIWFLSTPDQTLEAQQRSVRYPGDIYYSGFANYYRGDLRDAAKIFDRARATGYRGATSRWVDSVCYHTMMGECLYQLGEIDAALVQYDNALSYVLADPTWLSRVDFQGQQVTPRDWTQARITWGNPGRQLGNFPDTMSVLTGNNDGQQVLQQGGVFQRPELRQFNVAEIAKCITLAIQRRNQILGPLGKHDPMVSKLVSALNRNQSSINHWGKAWASIPLAMALRGQGNLDQAAGLLQTSVLIGGYYHPLSSHALLELGKIKLLQAKPQDAASFLMEATFPAAAYDQQDVLEEAFRWGTTVHLMSKVGGVYAPLEPAAQWARTRGSQQLKASLPLLAASCSLQRSDPVTAKGLLTQSKRFFGRTDLARSPWFARLAYAQAHAEFQSGELTQGMSSLGTSMDLLRNSGIWMFRLALVDRFFKSNSISERVADELYTLLLREPTAADWQIDPMETLSLVLTPHPGPYERWMAIAIARQETDRAIEIADRLRRHVFYCSLPLGGRALALRWMVSAPDDALNRDLLAARQKMLLRYPALVELQRKANALGAALGALPVNPDDASDERREQKQLLQQLASVSTAQEAMIGDLSLRREHSEFVFPPITTIPDIQQKLGEKQLVWMFVESSLGVYACMITQSESSLRPIPEAKNIRGELTQLYRNLGIYDRNSSLDAETLGSKDWHESIVSLRNILAPTRDKEFWAQFDEIVVIPDGLLWYLPFEMLPLGDDAEETLLSQATIRYAPTLGTSVTDKEVAETDRPLGVVTGRLFPKDTPEVAQEWFKEIETENPNAVQFETRLPGPSGLIGGLCDTILVLDDLDGKSSGLYGWAPMQLDNGENGSSLYNWMMLPWEGPATLVLPGFHTAAEKGLRQTATGQEIYSAICGLMASGCDTVLISRWRMAGQTSFELMREFVRELPNDSAAAAWQRSIVLAREQPLNPSAEPRLKESREAFPPDSRHPAFWAGYLLADRGANGEKIAEEGEEGDDEK
jgi:tetratricopeptide (TPR) repeat protein